MPFTQTVRVAGIALALVLAAALARGQQTTPRDVARAKPGAIAGTVVNQETTAPIRRAQVVVRSVTGDVRRQQTADFQGRFLFADLPRGEYIVRATRPGYLDSEYGQRAPGPEYVGTPIAVTSANTLKVVVPMRRGGVLGGTLTDDVGEPEHMVDVRALRLIVKNGRNSVEVAGTSRTDDLGGFRISSLPPGNYVLVAELPMELIGRDAAAPTDPAVTYAPVYFPSAGAPPISLRAGEQRFDLNFQPVRRVTARVTGTIANIAPSGVATVDLVPTDAWPFMPTQSVGLDATGGFAFEGVAPGTYSLVVTSGATTRIVSQDGRERWQMILNGRKGVKQPDLERRWATSTISVQESDVTGVTLTLQPGMQVAGQVTFDVRDRSTTSAGAINVLLTSTEFGDRNYAATGEVDAEGRFLITDVMPGKYRVTLFSERSWYVRSARMAGVDVLGELLEVRPNQHIDDATLTVTDRPTRLTGTVRASNGAPALDCTIVVFAEDQRYWTAHSRRIVTTRPSTDGGYALLGLPAGGYYVAAVSDWDSNGLYEPSYLRTLAGSSQVVHVIDGETVTAALQVATRD